MQISSNQKFVISAGKSSKKLHGNLQTPVTIKSLSSDNFDKLDFSEIFHLLKNSEKFIWNRHGLDELSLLKKWLISKKESEEKDSDVFRIFSKKILCGNHLYSKGGLYEGGPIFYHFKDEKNLKFIFDLDPDFSIKKFTDSVLKVIEEEYEALSSSWLKNSFIQGVILVFQFILFCYLQKRDYKSAEAFINRVNDEIPSVSKDAVTELSVERHDLATFRTVIPDGMDHEMVRICAEFFAYMTLVPITVHRRKGVYTIYKYLLEASGEKQFNRELYIKVSSSPTAKRINANVVEKVFKDAKKQGNLLDIAESNKELAESIFFSPYNNEEVRALFKENSARAGKLFIASLERKFKKTTEKNNNILAECYRRIVNVINEDEKSSINEALHNCTNSRLQATILMAELSE